MKKSPRLLLLIACATLLMEACTDEQKPVDPAIRLELDLVTDGLYDQSVPETGILLLTLASPTGVTIMEFEEVNYKQSDGRVVTDPLNLQPGRYVIRDAFLLDKNGDVLFAAPRNDSRLAAQRPQLVFSTASFSKTPLPLPLLHVGKNKPADFGYKSFKVARKEVLKLAVKVASENGFSAGQAFILHNLDTLEHYQLQPRVNVFKFNAEPGTEYRLVVIKDDGFSSYIRMFTSETLRNDWHGKPVVAEVVPAFTMVALANEHGTFEVEIDGFPGELNVDWGDGTSDTYLLSDPNVNDIVRQHTYPGPGKYFVSVTGVLDKVHTLLCGFTGNSEMERINIDQLTILNDLRFWFTKHPKSVDASKNQNLLFFIFWYTGVESIKISPTNPPPNIELEESRYVTPESFKRVMDDLYAHALTTGEGGTFISWAYHPDPSQPLLILPIGSPNEQTLDKMRILQNEYGWDFGPDVDYNFGSGEPF